MAGLRTSDFPSATVFPRVPSNRTKCSQSDIQSQVETKLVNIKDSPALGERT